MSQEKNYQYFVEGEDEEKIIKVLKTDMQLIVPGKVLRFNVVERKITKARLMSLRPDTNVILIFDTDTGNDAILKENIQILKKHLAVESVICVPQVKNLEDELVRACNIKQIKELTGSKSNGEFKRDLIKESNLKRKLENKQFDFSKFWSTSLKEGYDGIVNESEKIKCSMIEM